MLLRKISLNNRLCPRMTPLLRLWILVCVPLVASGFVTAPSKFATTPPLSSKQHRSHGNAVHFQGSRRASLHSTRLQLAPGTWVPQALSLPMPSSPIVGGAVLLVTAFCIYQRRRYLFQTDPDVDAPLPVGTYGGCPLFGSNVLTTDPDVGLNAFYHKTSKALGNPSVWKFLALGERFVMVSGADAVHQVLSKEFNGVDTAGSGFAGTDMIFGLQSILRSQDKREHSLLRRLVGQAMTPSSRCQSCTHTEASSRSGHRSNSPKRRLGCDGWYLQKVYRGHYTFTDFGT